MDGELKLKGSLHGASLFSPHLKLLSISVFLFKIHGSCILFEVRRLSNPLK